MNFQQFQEEFNKLKFNYPVLPTHNSSSEDAEYGDYLAHCTNAYFSFDNAESQGLIYIFDSFKAVNSCDGDYVINSQDCYDCVDVESVTHSAYMNYCSRVFDCYFCWDCHDSNNLFGCVYLKNKQYCIFNKQFKEEEYKAKIEELLQRPYEENLNEMKKLSQRYPVTQTLVWHSENCDYGNHLDYSKNLYLSFDAAYSENGAYLSDAHHDKYCYDLTQSFHCEFSYECVDSTGLNNCFYMTNCHGVYDSGFCKDCANSNHLFGCVALDKKEYCILNRQYSKEEYDKHVKEIIESFKQING